MNTSYEAYAARVGGFVTNLIRVIVLKLEDYLTIPLNFESMLNQIATETLLFTCPDRSRVHLHKRRRLIRK